MSSPVPLSFTLPRAAEITPDALVYGRTLVALAGGAHHLLAWHVRGWQAVDIWQGGKQSSVSTDSGLVHLEPAAAWLVLVAYHVPIGVEWVHVAMTALSVAGDAGTGTPEATVSVETATAVAVDDGATWTRADGSLPGRHTRDGGFLRLHPYTVESSPRTTDDPTPGTPGTPRRLYVGSEAGGVVMLRVETARCMPVCLYVLPEPEVTL